MGIGGMAGNKLRYKRRSEAICQEEVRAQCGGGLCAVGVSGRGTEEGPEVSTSDASRGISRSSPDEVTGKRIYLVARYGSGNRRLSEELHNLADNQERSTSHSSSSVGVSRETVHLDPH